VVNRWTVEEHGIVMFDTPMENNASDWNDTNVSDSPKNSKPIHDGLHELRIPVEA